ncbi:AT-hook motif nuclear-localized protein 6-like [Vicia villosa]|uniref:AT-hook motif nuclear-localized protein 6-like n=1 Tax=Vicia villosa TaxID=3911 RepID=UPI00273C7324|nr:AT-hook motif nuclear-localized protein 6-like [Vicia villosa]
MEEREIFGSGHGVNVNQVPQGFNLGQNQNSLSFSGPTGEAPATVPVSAPVGGGMEVKKKRGRPRKTESGSKPALSPMPISASIPLTGDFSGWKSGGGKPFESIKKPLKLNDFDEDDRTAPPSSNFKTHVLTVNSGEDLSMKIMSLSQQENHTISILTATGTISNVTLRQSDACGGTSTYEGVFEILSLSGSFVPTENGLTKSRAGRMSVSLAGPNGRVFGGALAGLLVAAGSVQVVVASFLPDHQKPKKQRIDHMSPTAPPTSTHINNHASDELKTDLGGMKPIMSPAGFNFATFGNGQGSGNSSSSGDDDEHVQP